MTRLLSIFFITLFLGIQNQKTVDLNTSSPVKIGATVIANEQIYFTDLRKEDFILTMDKTSQEILSVSKANEPASIVFLVDISGSMNYAGNSKKDRRNFLLPAIKNFLLIADKSNQYAVFSFSREVNLLQDWTGDQNTLVNQLENLLSEKGKGRTFLYEACRVGITKVSQGKYTRRIVIILSDGVDNSEDLGLKVPKLKDIRNLAQNENIFIYGVNLGTLFPENDYAGKMMVSLGAETL